MGLGAPGAVGGVAGAGAGVIPSGAAGPGAGAGPCRLDGDGALLAGGGELMAGDGALPAGGGGDVLLAGGGEGQFDLPNCMYHLVSVCQWTSFTDPGKNLAHGRVIPQSTKKWRPGSGGVARFAISD